MYQNGNLVLIYAGLSFGSIIAQKFQKIFSFFFVDYFHGITISITIWDNISVCIVYRKGQSLRLIEQSVKKGILETKIK